MTRKDMIKAMGSINLSSRAKRLEATTLAIGFIELIREAEKANIGRFLENFRNGYAFVKAYESFDIMTDAIIALRDAYY